MSRAGGIFALGGVIMTFYSVLGMNLFNTAQVRCPVDELVMLSRSLPENVDRGLPGRGFAAHAEDPRENASSHS